MSLLNNIHQRHRAIKSYTKKAERELSSRNFALFKKFDEEMVRVGLANTSRCKGLQHFVKLAEFNHNKDWEDATKEDIQHIVYEIMKNHSDESGKETNYSADLKKSIRPIVRFAKTGSTEMPEDGELSILRVIKLKTPVEHLKREDLPTKEDIDKLLAVCSDSIRDKALIAVHADAGTRIGELLSLRLKHITIDNLGGLISVDGKTGVRQIRIVSSVPYLVKWLNAHPDKDNPEAPLCIYNQRKKSLGKPMTYEGFKKMLNKRCRQAKISKRITTHLFRHAEATGMASKLTEAEMRLRYGWGKTSHMPSRYTHLNPADLDNKILRLNGMLPKEEEPEPALKQCNWCNLPQASDAKHCENCGKPLDVKDAINVEKEDQEKQIALMREIARQEHANFQKQEQIDKMQKIPFN